MKQLLERILNIIANDAFPDEDKPYIIREVVQIFNDNDAIKEEAFREGYKEGKKVMDKVTRSTEVLFGTDKTAYDKGYEEGAKMLIGKYYSAAATEAIKENAFKDGQQTGFKSGVHTADVRHKEALEKATGESYVKGLADGHYNGLQTTARLIDKELIKGVQYE